MRAAGPQSVGAYTLDVRPRPLDDDPDVREEATALGRPADVTVEGALERPGDDDWFVFEAHAGDYIDLAHAWVGGVEIPGELVAPLVEQVDAEGVQDLGGSYRNDRGGGTAAFSAQTDGPIYIRFHVEADGKPVTYSLTVRVSGGD